MCAFCLRLKKGVLGVVFGPVPMPFPPRQGTCKPEHLFGFGIAHEKPATSAGVSVWRVSRCLCHASETGGATRCVYLWAV